MNSDLFLGRSIPLIVLLALMISCSSDKPNQANRHSEVFSIKDIMAVHPATVMLLSGSIADVEPYIISIDDDSIKSSNKWGDIEITVEESDDYLFVKSMKIVDEGDEVLVKVRFVSFDVENQTAVFLHSNIDVSSGGSTGGKIILRAERGVSDRLILTRYSTDRSEE